ncbi:MAG TPA: M1 family metallopeptidase [Chthoniobacterales bacterium]|nr:M1 family metallopeptidase [Chthoniobacterales bacterium]
MRILAGLSVLFALVTTMAAEKPYDFAGTPGKLPKQVVPLEYAIRIVPDLGKLTFAGSEKIKVKATASVREFVLNSAELEIAKASVDGTQLSPDAIKLDPDNELLTIALPKELPAGEHVLGLEFSGKITPKGRGFYYMPYQEQGTGAKKLALGTQFEPSDARRFFPGWDEPSFRARFQFTAVVPENWLAVSNMPIESERKIEIGKEVRFQATPSMSSYLNVFVAGELDLIETKVAGTQIRVIATKGKAEWGRYALESTAQILQYYNDYFGVAYPLPKLDQIAIPGGFGGAMENWGGITYYESALLFDPKKSSAATRQRIYEVIAHETAHQWFGDLVTMAWWDNLWLNEGFASWMGSKCTAHFNPDWEVWLAKNIQRDPARRSGISKEVAMEGDARSTTHAIQQPVANESDANSAFDDITYRKGQSFLRMLESFLGENVFRDGIRRYMAAHKYSNSTTADLWNALSEASGKPVGEIAAAWTEQPGFLVLVMKRAGDKISLSQERFTINFPNAPALEWKIPLTYFVVGENKIESRLMTGKIENLPNAATDRVIKLNANGAGNYRVQYDEPSWKALLGALPKLNLEDRVNLLCDSWALVHANRADIPLYLDLIAKLPPGHELAERDQIVNAFDYINRLLVGDPVREKFQASARSILRPTFDQLGWEPKKNESPRDSLLRASLIVALADWNDQEIIDGCKRRFEKFVVDPGSLQPNLRASVCFVAGQNSDEATWNKLHELGLKTTSIEEKQNYYDALNAARDPKLAAKALQISLTDELPTSRALHVVGKVARYSGHPDLAWDFAKANMKALLEKTDALGANTFAPGLFVFFSERARADELKTYAKSNLPATSVKEVAKAVDEVEFRAEFKQRLMPQLNRWISSQTKRN